MAYTTNPHMPKVRQAAAEMVRRGYTPTQVGRRFGVGSSTVCKWVRKARVIGYHPIPTLSSRPKHHPHQLSEEPIRAVVNKRLELGRSAEVIQVALAEGGIRVSLASVKRTLDRHGLLKKRSPWKRWHVSVVRPEVKTPGDLVQIDTVHLPTDEKTIYVFTGIDVCTRTTHAHASLRANTKTAVSFVQRMKNTLPFEIHLLQSDNGSEFSTSFSERVHVEHRHSRVRRPNDNAHLERFNRTLQEECLNKLPRDIRTINRALPAYLKWYNEERHHFGLGLKTPKQKLQEYVQAIG